MKKIIVCVDDEKIVLDSLKKELKELAANDYLIEIAESGIESFEIVNEHIGWGNEVVLVISDYIMPEMKGDEVLKSIKNLSPGTFSILLTGQATIEGVTNAINNASLYRYISKPWETNDILLTVTEALKAYDREKELEIKRIRLEEANANLLKLDSAKTYFLGLLSHELKTPLIGINGNAKMILEVTEDPDIKECALDILSSEARLRKFSELSLLITRIQTDKYESTLYQEKIQDIIDSTIFNINDRFKENKISIIKELYTSELIFNVDIGLIAKVFEIILDNAIKFSPKESSILIRLEEINGKVVVQIVDKGKGFSDTTLTKAFEFFVSSDDLMSHSEGTGLSLATAKAIMDFHNFEITAKNSANGGAIVELRF